MKNVDRGMGRSRIEATRRSVLASLPGCKTLARVRVPVVSLRSTTG
jgi:hypothetical protein